MSESEPLLAMEFKDGAEEAILGALHPGESCRVAPTIWNGPAFAPFYPSSPPGVQKQFEISMVVSDQAIYYVGLGEGPTGFEILSVVRLASSQITSATVNTAIRKNGAGTGRGIVGVDEQVVVLTLWYDYLNVETVETLETRYDVGLDRGKELVRVIDEWNGDTWELSATVRCPWCAEEILAAAKKCKHCGEYLGEQAPADEANLPVPIVASAEASSDDHHQCPDCFAVFGSSQEVNAHKTDLSCPRPDSRTSAQTVRTGAPPVAVELVPTSSSLGVAPSLGGFADFLLYGSVHPNLVCPHCQKKGAVHQKKSKRKQGISGGKATGAVLTGGLSLLATGLSRKQAGTEMYCSNCGTSWFVS